MMFLYVSFLYCLSGFHVVKSVQVTTKNGVVEGIQSVTAEENKTYYAFLGIPYAKPPIGDLRFQPPQPAENWTGIWNATYEKDTCVTSAVIVVLGSENCLYVNVFTTEIPTSENAPLKPVMFWIHGGGFAYGSGNTDTSGPDYLLNEGVVVVTINYRLGMFGFSSTEDLVLPGNNGIKDQILALKWANENIAYFGGDPKKITIFGQSAGSVTVSYIVQSPLAAGLFSGAILQSGTTLSQWSLSRTPREFAFDVGRRLLIFTNDSNTLVERLRGVSVEALQLASNRVSDQIFAYSLLEGFQLAPVREPEHPGAVFTGRSCELLRNGSVNAVPLMVGITSREGLFVLAAIDIFRGLLATYDLNPARLTPVDMNINDSVVRRRVGNTIHRQYVGPLGTMLFSPNGFIDFFSDSQFAYPTRQYVKFVSSHVSTYYYQFSYEGKLGNPDRGNRKGVSHGEDLNYLFRVPASDSASTSDTLTRQRMVKMWTNFAKYGNPTPDADPLLQNVSWSVASSSSNLTYLNIDSNLQVGTNPKSQAINFWDNLYNTYAQPPCYTF